MYYFTYKLSRWYIQISQYLYFSEFALFSSSISLIALFLKLFDCPLSQIVVQAIRMSKFYEYFFIISFKSHFLSPARPKIYCSLWADIDYLSIILQYIARIKYLFISHLTKTAVSHEFENLFVKRDITVFTFYPFLSVRSWMLFFLSQYFI